MLFSERVRSLPLLSPTATKKRGHTTPRLPRAMADCASSRQHKAVYQYQRPSVMNSLLCAESDKRLSMPSYFVSVDAVKVFFIFLCYVTSLHFYRDDIGSICDIRMRLYVIFCYELRRMFPLVVLKGCKA